MPGELSPFMNRMLQRDSRRAGRVLSQHRSDTQIRIGQIDAETDVAFAKTDSVTMATGYAMTSVVRVAQAQRQLEQLAPEASGRLNFLADDHMLSMSDVMADLRRELRRS